MNVTKEDIEKVLTAFVSLRESELLTKSDEEIVAEWFWVWDKNRSIQQNLYEFTVVLEIHKRRWRRWEEHHHGHFGVVGRVRDKYVMPRIREFFLALTAHEQETD